MNIVVFLIIIFFLLFSFFFCLLSVFKFILSFLFWGAIYVPTKPETVKKMIGLANIKSGEKAIDLGSGDGRLVVALAEAGAEAHGYEINPFLVQLAKKNIRKAGLEGKAFIHWKSFWSEDFSKFNVVTVYGMGHMMKRLELKLKKELRLNSRIISNTFTFPDWLFSKKDKKVNLYVKNF